MKLSRKHYKSIDIGFKIAFAILGFICFLILLKEDNTKFKECAFSGIITKIKIEENNRGFPSYKINGTWLEPDLSAQKIYDIVQVNDSIDKKSGSILIEVFRKTKDSIYEKILSK